jgi:hypothetical protein
MTKGLTRDAKTALGAYAAIICPMPVYRNSYIIYQDGSCIVEVASRKEGYILLTATKNTLHTVAAPRTRRKASSEVPAHIMQQCTYKQVGEFGYNQATYKRSPIGHLALLLASLINIATVDKERLQLRNNTGCDKNEVKNSKEVLLKVCKAISNKEEVGAVEEC